MKSIKFKVIPIYILCRQMYTVLCYLTQFLLNVAQHFLAYIRLIFRGSFVEITTAMLLVYKIPLDVLVIDICNSHSAFTIDLLEAY
jgi:hypothetical protein